MSTRRFTGNLADAKIVILIAAFVRGGSERQAYLLARELRHRHGLNIEVWALKFAGEFAEEFEAMDVPTRVLGFHPPGYSSEGVQARRIPVRILLYKDPLFLLRWARRLWRVGRHLKDAKVDILLPFTTWPNVIAGLTYRLAGVRVCIWGERSAGSERAPDIEGLAVSQYRQFVANSTAGAEFLVRELRVPSGRVAVVPNGVEEPKILADTDWRAKLGLRPGQLLVVKVANISSHKDHATVLRAWKIVQASWTGAEPPVLALAGSHSDRYEACQAFVRESGLESTVRFLGSIRDVPALVAACDLTVFSSPKEGMPNGVLECMAGGKAVIASDLPGVRDAFGPKGADVLVPSGDAEQFAAKILQLLTDRDRRQAIGAANRARIQAEFSVQRMAERQLQVMQAHLTKSPAIQRAGLVTAPRLP